MLMLMLMLIQFPLRLPSLRWPTILMLIILCTLSLTAYCLLHHNTHTHEHDTQPQAMHATRTTYVRTVAAHDVPMDIALLEGEGEVTTVKVRAWADMIRAMLSCHAH